MLLHVLTPVILIRIVLSKSVKRMSEFNYFNLKVSVLGDAGETRWDK